MQSFFSNLVGGGQEDEQRSPKKTQQSVESMQKAWQDHSKKRASFLEAHQRQLAELHRVSDNARRFRQLSHAVKFEFKILKKL